MMQAPYHWDAVMRRVAKDDCEFVQENFYLPSRTRWLVSLPATVMLQSNKDQHNNHNSLNIWLTCSTAKVVSAANKLQEQLRMEFFRFKNCTNGYTRCIITNQQKKTFLFNMCMLKHVANNFRSRTQQSVQKRGRIQQTVSWSTWYMLLPSLLISLSPVSSSKSQTSSTGRRCGTGDIRAVSCWWWPTHRQRFKEGWSSTSACCRLVTVKPSVWHTMSVASWCSRWRLTTWLRRSTGRAVSSRPATACTTHSRPRTTYHQSVTSTLWAKKLHRFITTCKVAR